MMTSLPSSPEPSSMTLVAEGERGVPKMRGVFMVWTGWGRAWGWLRTIANDARFGQARNEKAPRVGCAAKPGFSLRVATHREKWPRRARWLHQPRGHHEPPSFHQRCIPRRPAGDFRRHGACRHYQVRRCRRPCDADGPGLSAQRSPGSAAGSGGRRGDGRCAGPGAGRRAQGARYAGRTVRRHAGAAAQIVGGDPRASRADARIRTGRRDAESRTCDHAAAGRADARAKSGVALVSEHHLTNNQNEYTSVTEVWVSVFFLSSGTLVSLRAVNAAFICMVLLILVLSEVSAIECVLTAPRSTLMV